MVEVQVARGPEGSVQEIECSGHAGFDDGEGLDLVCAAVSALTGALGLGLSEVLQSSAQLEVGPGSFRARVEATLPEEQALLKTMALALEQLGQHYPGFLIYRSRKA